MPPNTERRSAPLAEVHTSSASLSEGGCRFAFGDCQPSANAKPSKQARICFWLCNDTARGSRFEQNHSSSRIHLGASALAYTCPQIMAASMVRFDFSQPGAYLRMCGLGPIASPIDYNLKPVQTKRSGNPKVGTPGPMTSPSRCEALHTSTIRRLPASIRAPATVTARRRSTRVSSARLGAGVRPRCGREGSAHHQTWRQGKRSVHAAVVWLSAPVRRI